jgi:hypothetical protein
VRTLLLLAILFAALGCRRAPEVDRAPERDVVVTRPVGDGPLAAAVVVMEDDRRFVVLDAQSSGAEAIGPTSMTERDGITIVTRAATESRVRGTRVALYGDHGLACEASLGASMFLARVSFDTAPSSADEAWNGAGRRMLVAEIADADRCGNVHFARDASFAPPMLGLAREADPATTARALAFIRALPAYVGTQTRYESEVAAPRTKYWDEFDGAAPIVTDLRGYLWVSMSAGVGCGEFGGAFSALLREEHGVLHVDYQSTTAEQVPVAVLGSGPEPTVMFPAARLARDENGYELELTTVEWQGCSC